MWYPGAPEPKKLRREELYEKVWTTPTARLAEEFGISDVAIAKICRKYNIPKPPKGYWARVQNGHVEKREVLPRWTSERSPLISIYRALASFVCMSMQ
jgi:hypothetical protein